MTIRNRSVGALLVAEVVSSTGTQMTWIALPWFVLVTTGSPSRMAWVAAAEIAAAGVSAILSGPLATRIGSRTTMLACDGARAPLMALIPLLHVLGALPFPALLVLVAATGVFASPSFAAQYALVPDLVGEDERVVAKAATFFQAANRMTILLGPVAGGILIGAIGATNVLWVDAATYVVSFAIVSVLVPRTRPHEGDGGRGLDGILGGARFLWRDRLLRVWTLASLVTEVCWQAIFVSLPFLVYSEYDRDAHLVGFIFGGFGAGALVGSVVVYRLLDRYEPLLLASVGMLLQSAPLFLLLFDASAWVEVAALFGSGVANPVVNASASGVRLLRTPRALRQRASQFTMATSSVTTPFVLLVVGPALAHWGARPVLAVVVVVQAAAVCVWSGAGFAARATARAGATVDSAA